MSAPVTATPAPLPPQGQSGAQRGGAAAPGAGYNPLQPSYWGGAPLGQATLAGANVSPQAALRMLQQGYAPMQRQQDAAMRDQLASMGINGGGAQGALQLLSGQQTAAEAPAMAQTTQNAQGMTLQEALANAASMNAMTSQNVNNAQQTGLANMGAANNASSQLAQMLQQGWSLPYESMASIYGQGLGAAGGLAGSEANNFAVPQQASLLSQLGL